MPFSEPLPGDFNPNLESDLQPYEPYGPPLTEEEVEQNKKKVGEERIRELIQNLKRYEIPQEALDLLNYYQETAGDLEKSRDLSGQVTSIAKSRTGVSEAPGMGIARRDAQQLTAQNVANILQAGGGVGALGAISQAGLNEQAALRDIAMTNMQYRTQAEKDLMGALASEAGMSQAIDLQQADLMSKGYGAMMTQKAMQYETDVDKQLTEIQFESALLGLQNAEMQEMKNRRSQILSAGLTTLGSIVGGVIGYVAGGPGGAAAGVGVGGSAGKWASNKINE